MNLQSTISERLWEAVRSTYESGNYSGAILDSIYLLSDVIRDKSGLESDGVQLVGAAFSGPNPIIKVNALHTQSDQDEQKGVHFLLMGLYQAVRNPRSHEKRVDPSETADAIICFVDYLLGLIDKARSPFDEAQIVVKVIDPLFGQSEKYANLIVARVPARKLLEVLINVFNRRNEFPERNFRLFVEAVLKQLNDEEKRSFWEVASEALESAASDADFRSVIQITQKEWGKISEVARLRTEHRLVASVGEGEYNSAKRTCVKGVLGTWATGIAEKMDLKSEYEYAVARRITSVNRAARDYAYRYHFDTYRRINPSPPNWVINRLRTLLTERDQPTYNALCFIETEALRNENDGQWVEELKEAYDAFTPPEISDEDIPF